MRILVVGEAGPDTGGDWASGERSDGAIPILVRKVIESWTPGLGSLIETEGGRLHRFRGRDKAPKGYKAKVAETIREANRQGFDAVVVVVDRDGEKNDDRIRNMKDGRDIAVGEVPVKAVVGAAVETMEAWLLADEPAIGRALGMETPPARGPDPEKLRGKSGQPDHPKTVLKCILARDEHGRSYVEQVEAIAREADVEIIERRCSKGFKPFADEIRERLVPLTPSSSR